VLEEARSMVAQERSIIDRFDQDKFGLDLETDKPTVIEIAKLSAQQDALKTVNFFGGFGLNPGTDKEAIIAIAKLCVQKSPWG